MSHTLFQSSVPGRWFSLGAGLSGLLIAALLAVPNYAYCDWSEIDEILRQTYGPDVARECSDYYDSLDIAETSMNDVKEAVSRLVEAGYPSGCPREYLKLAADLSKAGINLGDLTSKIREGIAKKVSPDRLNRVIAHRVDALKEARTVTLNLAGEGVTFLDKQMAYTIIADYLLRGIPSDDLMAGVAAGELKEFPALENVIK